MSFGVGVVAQFTASHHLVGDFGPASSPHTHTYRVEVGVTGETLRPDGTLFDITVLQQAVAAVTGDLEGRNLNELSVPPVASPTPTGPTSTPTPAALSSATKPTPLDIAISSPGEVAMPTPVSLVWPNPTAEVVARYVFDRVSGALSGSGLARLEAKVWESPEAYASYSGALA